MATYKLVNSDKLDAAMTATADAIRAKTGSTDPIAWDAEKGMSEAVEPVFEAGKKAEYDAFWDEFQNYGKRQTYEYVFSFFNDRIFAPKYDIKINGYATGCFKDTKISNIKETLEKLGVKLDTENAVWLAQMFQNTKSVSIPQLNLANALNLAHIFTNSEIEFIESLINIKETSGFTNAFQNTSKLKYIRFQGIIGDGIDIHWSTALSKESILSLINVLSTTITGKTVTLSLTAVNTAFEISPGAADGSTSEEWAALIATKPNWTISLA